MPDDELDKIATEVWQSYQHKHTVDEIRSMPEKKAFKEIRKGRWVQGRAYD